MKRIMKARNILGFNMYISKFIPFQKLPKGAFNNYVDKMRGEGVKKCLFLSTLRV